MTIQRIVVALCGTLVLAACNNFDVPDLNRPLLDQVSAQPTPVTVAALATGLVGGSRADIAERIGYVSELGILGRESYVLSGSDDRFVAELLNGSSLDPSTPNFGGNFWVAPYANLRNANLLIDSLPKVDGLTDPQKESVRGFAKTMMALDLLKIINTHDFYGAAIDVDLPVGQLAPIVSKDEVFTRIALLLDQAQVHLAAASPAFPFGLGNGFNSFNLPGQVLTPAQFLLVNRALAGRVAVYRGKFPEALTALAASFLDTGAPLSLGAYHAYGNGSGDSQNSLNTTDILAHPSIVSDADPLSPAPPGCNPLPVPSVLTCLDNRLQAKVTAVTPVSLYKLTSAYGFILYPSTDSPVAIIRNEELILLRAEANIGLVLANNPAGDLGAAKKDINTIRAAAGIANATGLDKTNILDELLKQKRYSLLFEGGHRWIDARRYGKLGTLPIDVPGQYVQTAFPIPTAETDARH